MGTKKVDLAFGRHSLKVFAKQEFAHLALKHPPEEKRTWWEVRHEGRTICVPKVKEITPSVDASMFEEKEHWGLVALLKDPSWKGNLLAVRKQGLDEHFGRIRVFSTTPSGVESLVATVNLHNKRGNAFLSDLAVVPYLAKTPFSRPSSVVKVEKHIEKLKRSLGSQIRNKAKTIEEIAIFSSIKKDLERGFDLSVRGFVTTPSVRSRPYRRKKIAPLLIMLAEELAKKAGFKKISMHADKFTTGKFILKHGWQLVDEKDPDYYHCEKRL